MSIRIRLDILRRKNAAAEPYLQSFDLETDNDGATVAYALSEINSRPDIRDVNGETAEPIEWEHSCLQKKCGACAMVINGSPRLACGARLSEFSESVKIEPLRKFPVVADLLVDRSAVFEQLKRLELWANSELAPPKQTDELAYEASRCLQCGCCLEVCPNFYVGGAFMGMSSAVTASRLIEQLPPEERRALAKRYSKGFYSGCGKSLACRDICPAGIDIERLMVNSNAAALWKGLLRRKR